MVTILSSTGLVHFSGSFDTPAMIPRVAFHVAIDKLPF
jgi:hypothetical protein